ncbi:hypothetical protein D3C87_934060 [compost metagenome]
MRKEVEVLEDHAHIATQVLDLGLGTGQGLAEDGDMPLVDGLERVDAAQERALARAARAQENDLLARVDMELDAVEHPLRAEGLSDVVEDDHAVTPCARRMRVSVHLAKRETG